MTRDTRNSQSFEMSSAQRWRVGKTYLTLKPSQDGNSVRIYAKGQSGLGKCGVVMKVRRSDSQTASQLTVQMVNEALVAAVRCRLPHIVHLDERADGTISISLAPGDCAADLIIDPAVPHAMTRAVLLLHAQAKGDANGQPTTDHLDKLALTLNAR